MPGTLFVVGTPIGNLEDITLRALRVLKEAQVVAAEDTRQTGKLLQHYGINTVLVSYHEHNERTRGEQLVERLLGGDDVALVTDAGMPGVSDPGGVLIGLALGAGVPVVPVPGPTAAVTALVVSGLPGERWAFDGFLPRKGKERKAALERLRAEDRSVVFYEAPHRILDTLTDLADALGARPMAACRELTKKFEEIRRGTPTDLLAHFRAHAPRGEFTLVIGPAPAADASAAPAPAEADLAAAVAALVGAGTDRKEAMREVGRRFGVSKRDVYQAVLAAEKPDTPG